ncbi:MAG: hypothetical protein NDI67_06750 [Sulfuritalea sp.]|nr:hypothetical protein [Sulfuritalea sp.]
MRNGLPTFCRARLWRLLVGALGVAICGGEVWAADAGPRTAMAPGLNDALPSLRLSPQLGDRRRTDRRKPARDAWRSLGAEAPLNLSLTILLQPAGTSTVKGSTSRIVSPGAATGRAGPARRSSDGDRGDGPDQPEAPVPFDPTPAVAGARRPSAGAERPAPGKAKPVDSGLPDLSGETWVMAPIRWSGNTGTSGNYFGSDDGSKSLSIANTLNVQANSFIGAPYIAQWSGVFGMSSADSTFTPAGGSVVKSDSSGLNFGGSVNVFPVSRFPFSATFNHGTSESRAGESRAPTTNTAISLRQQYRTEVGDTYSASYNRNSFVSGASTSQNSSLNGSFSARRVFDFDHYLEGDHSLNASLAFSPSTSDLGGQKSRLLNANASHSWTVHEDLSIGNSITLASTQRDQFVGDTLARNDSRVFLAATNFIWRPVEDLPLTLTGGGNFSQTQIAVAGELVRQQTLAANLSTSYRFSNNLSVSGNASVASTSSGMSRFTSGTAGASASYSGDPLKFGDYVYGWNLGGGLSGNVVAQGESSVGLSTSAGHNLTRTLVIDESQALNLNVAQTASYSQTRSGPATALSHSFGAAWRAGYGEALTVSLSANFSDNISTGQSGNNHYRNMTIAGTGAYQVSSRAALSANANLNWSQNLVDTSSLQIVNGLIGNDGQSQVSGSFSLGYSHSSPFSIRNLYYNASVLWINSQSGNRLANSDPFSTLAQKSFSLQQLLDYRIGRLTFRLNHAMIDQAGRKSASIFGSVNREFDGFFDGRW